MHVRSLIARVQRLEQSVAPPKTAFGDLEVWEAEAQEGIDAGKLCPLDAPIVLRCIRRWSDDGVWGLWFRRGQVWLRG